MAYKKQTLKEYNKFTQAIQAKTPKQKNTRKEKYAQDSGMSTNITESAIKFIALDNQLMFVVEDQGFLRHLAILYIYSTLSCNVPVCALVWWVSYSRACKTGNQGDADRV